MGFDKLYRKLLFKDGTAVYKLKIYSQTLTPTAGVAAASIAEETYAVTGLTTDDRILAINNPASIVCGIVGMRVSAANTLAISWVNPTAARATPVAGTYKVISIRQ